MEDGVELVNASSHRVLTLRQTKVIISHNSPSSSSSSSGSELPLNAFSSCTSSASTTTTLVYLTAHWRTLTKLEYAHLSTKKQFEGSTLGRLHSTCALNEKSRVFFGGGPSYRCSSSLVLMKRCHTTPSTTTSRSSAIAAGSGDDAFITKAPQSLLSEEEEELKPISWKWKNKGMPLGPYHYWDSDNINSVQTNIPFTYSSSSTAKEDRLEGGNNVEQDDKNISTNAKSTRTKSTKTTTTFIPPMELARMDCLLESDPYRPGEAYMYGGYRGDELGDTWKLVVGIPRKDEELLYGKRMGHLRTTVHDDDEHFSSTTTAASRSRRTSGFLHRFWG